MAGARASRPPRHRPPARPPRRVRSLQMADYLLLREELARECVARAEAAAGEDVHRTCDRIAEMRPKGSPPIDAVLESMTLIFPVLRTLGKKWFLCKRGIWRTSSPGEAELWVAIYLRKIWKNTAELAAAQYHRPEAKRVARFLDSPNNRWTVVRRLQLAAQDPALATMDEDYSLLAFKDGVWDWKLRAFRPAAPEDYVSDRIEYPFPRDPPDEGTRALLRRYLEPIYSGSPADLQLGMDGLLRCLGGAPFECPPDLVMLGTGPAGRTEMVRLAAAVLGRYVNHQIYDCFSGRRAKWLLKQMRGTRLAAATGYDCNVKAARLQEMRTEGREHAGDGRNARAIWVFPEYIMDDGAAEARKWMELGFLPQRHDSVFLKREGQRVTLWTRRPFEPVEMHSDPTRRVFLKDSEAIDALQTIAPALMHCLLFGLPVV